MPWIAENNLVLYPGESVVVSLPNDAQGLLPLTLVATGEDAKTHALAPGEISFEFTVNKDGVTLKAQSAHGRWLHYMLVMVTPDGKPHKTSVCPIMAGKGAYEFWPHGIVQLALANFTPVAEGEMVCK